MISTLKNIPYFGVGLGLRKELAPKILDCKKNIDVLETTTEHYLNIPFTANELLNSFRTEMPLIPHGLNLSIGSAEKLDYNYLRKIKEFCDYIKAPYYSDHFALTEVNGVSIGHLSPLWFTKESLEIVVERIDKIQNFLGLPLVLENITSYFVIPHADFEEPEFISEVCKRTGCGLLLDLANIHINAHNYKLKPLKWLERFPISNVVHIHLAGGELDKHNWYHDTHSQEIIGINNGIWDLLRWIVQKSNIRTIIIERDDNFKEDFEEMILKDIRTARTILLS